MDDMMKLYKMGGEMPLDETLILNTASPLIERLNTLVEDGNTEKAESIAEQIYTLSSLSQRQLTADELVKFLDNSYDILNKI